MLWPALAILLTIYCSLCRALPDFRPETYKKINVQCRTPRRMVDKSPGEEDVTDISLSYVDINPSANMTIVMVHGWPSLWSSWARQIVEFEDAYRLIIPDLRGFSDSSYPHGSHSRTSGSLQDIVVDLDCILKYAGVGSAVCMGHDWGSVVCYEAGRSRPDFFNAVVGVVVPYIPASGPFAPMKELAEIVPSLSYQLFFDKMTSKAAQELDRDVRRTLRATLRSVSSAPPKDFLMSRTSYLGAWDAVDEIEPIPFLSADEEDYFVSQYVKSGFRSTLGFYMSENRYLDWKTAHEQGNHTLLQPVLAIYPTEDPVADWELVASLLNSSEYLPNLDVEMVPGAHWPQLEFPETYNFVVKNWLEKVFPRAVEIA